MIVRLAIRLILVLLYAIIAGPGGRLPPVLMAAFVASFGFIPMALSSSTGAASAPGQLDDANVVSVASAL